MNIFDIRPSPDDDAEPYTPSAPRPGQNTWTVPALGIVEMDGARVLLDEAQHRRFELSVLLIAEHSPVDDAQVVSLLEEMVRARIGWPMRLTPEAATADTITLDRWVGKDPDARSWKMFAYPAGFVACILTDGRNERQWEFGNPHALVEAFQVARQEAARAVRAGLPRSLYAGKHCPGVQP